MKKVTHNILQLSIGTGECSVLFLIFSLEDTKKTLVPLQTKVEEGDKHRVNLL